MNLLHTTGLSASLQTAAHPRRPTTELVGSRYVILNTLAHGGMGSVYRVLDRLGGRVITLKRLRTETAGIPDGSTGRLDLAREFQLLASLRHPNIIGVLDYGFDDLDRPYFTMELTEGADTLLEAGRDQPLGIQVDLLVQTLRALAYVHHRGIVHRDIKPLNILVHRGEVKLLDFGLSFHHASPPDPQSTTTGTIAYLAPEVLAGAPSSIASDLFAFGVVMYEMLVGRHPFDPDDEVGFWQRLSSARLPLPAEGVDRRLEPVLARLLARDPADRFPDAGDVIAALSGALDREIPVETVASRESFLQSATFIGRTRETRILGEALARTIDGEGGAWLIGGESGVGKSRLLEEVRCHALVRGVATAKGQASANGGEPFALWRDVLPVLVLAADGIGPRLASDLKLVLPGIDGLLEIAVPAPLIDAESVEPRILLALQELFELVKRPVAILLEDLQWADSASMKLVAAAARAAVARKVLILGTYRDDELESPAAAVPMARLLELQRLDAAQTAQLVESMIGKPGRDPGLVRFLLEETEGIPFFLVELVRSMAEETGSLGRVAARPNPSVGVSDGTRRLLMRRLARVPADLRTLVEVAAVIGREIDFQLLSSLVDESSIVHACTRCVGVGVFSAEEDRFRFAHDKLREHVLHELGAQRRLALHREVAESIEKLQPTPERYVAALAHHWRGAGNTSKEREACERAGHQALRSGACAEAVHFFDRALELFEGTSPSARPRGSLLERLLDPNLRVDPRSEAFRAARLEVGLTESHFRLGDFHACRVHAQRAMKLCGVEMPVSPARIRIDVLRQLARRLLQALFRFRSRDDGSAEVAREMVKVQAWLYEACFFALEPMGLVWSVLSMANHCAPLGPSAALARSHMALALITGAAGLHPLARRWSHSSIAIAKQVCTKSELGYLLNRVNNYRFVCCDWETADREIASAAGFAEEIGDRRVWEEARSMQGMSALFHGRFESGVKAWSEAQASSERSGNVQIECWSLLGQADNLVRLGRHADAVELYHRALERFAGRAHVTESIWANGMLSLACLHVGDFESAEHHAGIALGLLEATRPVAYWTQFGTAATFEVFLILADAADDAAERSAFLRKAGRARTCMRNFARAFSLGRPFHLLLDGQYQWLRGRKRLAMRRWKQCVATSEALRMPYEHGRACFEIAMSHAEHSAERAEYLERAQLKFRQCGAARDLAVAAGTVGGLAPVVP